MQLLMSGLGGLIMFAVCGLTAFFIIAEERRGHGGTATQNKSIGVRTIRSQLVDARPLSLEEVFPGLEVRPVPGAAAYGVGMTHIDTDCDIAATGTLARLLEDNGCTQVVRADLTAPYGGYEVTTGVFNFADEWDATLIGDQVGRHLEAGDGSFAAMTAGRPGSDPAVQPLSQVGWRSHGHFLLYCVITRPDGQMVPDNDPDAQRIATDLVESYLSGTIIGQRALSP
jgi:hypothetical protein